MDRGKLKARAKEGIKGKIGILFLIYLVYVAVASALSYFTWGLGSWLVTGGVMLAFCNIYLAILSKDKKPEVKDLAFGFTGGNFERGFFGYIRYTVFVFLWSLLLVIPGIVKSYAYSQMFFILADNKGMSAGEAQKKSIKMMDGHKMELFVLHLSFIPWFLLGAITFGIAFVWVIPYFEVTLAAYYEQLKKGAVKKAAA
ncbi:DUF975 family protein [Candidatus Saccharibacteria bacterium]|nr:DUF975 family protein [Candidatus Saccharibacteria bacterium]